MQQYRSRVKSWLRWVPTSYRIEVQPTDNTQSRLRECAICREILHLRSFVIWTLEAVGSATRVRLEHNGFEKLGGLAVGFMLGRGWRSKW